jgi:hypothetical protein
MLMIVSISIGCSYNLHSCLQYTLQISTLPRRLCYLYYLSLWHFFNIRLLQHDTSSMWLFFNTVPLEHDASSVRLFFNVALFQRGSFSTWLFFNVASPMQHLFNVVLLQC